MWGFLYRLVILERGDFKIEPHSLGILRRLKEVQTGRSCTLQICRVRTWATGNLWFCHESLDAAQNLDLRHWVSESERVYVHYCLESIKILQARFRDTAWQQGWGWNVKQFTRARWFSLYSKVIKKNGHSFKLRKALGICWYEEIWVICKVVK